MKMKFKFIAWIVTLVVLSAPLATSAADTATIRCVGENAGFYLDGVFQPYMTENEVREIDVLPDGSLLQLWSCGWEDLPDVGCQYIDYIVLPNTEWNVQPICGSRIVLQEVNDCNYVLDLFCPSHGDPQTFIDGLTVQLNGYTGSMTCPPVDSIYWAWGDGTAEYHWFPNVHEYQYPGEYTVCAASFAGEYELLGTDSCSVKVPPSNNVACEGFAPPMSGDHPLGARKNHVLPFMMKLFDSERFELTDGDLVKPPIIQVIPKPSTDEPIIDVSDDVIYAGLGTDGNTFDYEGGAYWHYNLKVSNYSAPAEYVVTAVSGDETEYTINPTCVGSFVVK